MTLVELYSKINGNYEDAINRLRYEPLVKNLLCMFLEDPNWERLNASLNEKNWGEVFSSAHALKGVCATLGLSRLETMAAAFANNSRGGNPITEYTLFLQKAADEYDMVIREIKLYLSESKVDTTAAPEY